VLTQRGRSEDIVAMSYATVTTRTHAKGVPSLLVLTESDVFVFEVEWDRWYCPPELDDGDVGAPTAARWDATCEDPVGFALDSDEMGFSRQTAWPLPFQTEMQQFLAGKDSGLSVLSVLEGQKRDTRVQAREDAINKTVEVRCTNRRAEGRRQLLREVREYFHTLESFGLSKLSEVVFGETDAATLELAFGARRVEILFFDDLGREVWRRSLAYVLNKSDTASQWTRDWVQ
jgi:hypothetical protein